MRVVVPVLEPFTGVAMAVVVAPATVVMIVTTAAMVMIVAPATVVMIVTTAAMVMVVAPAAVVMIVPVAITTVAVIVPITVVIVIVIVVVPVAIVVVIVPVTVVVAVVATVVVIVPITTPGARFVVMFKLAVVPQLAVMLVAVVVGVVVAMNSHEPTDPVTADRGDALSTSGRVRPAVVPTSGPLAILDVSSLAECALRVAALATANFRGTTLAALKPAHRALPVRVSSVGRLPSGLRTASRRAVHLVAAATLAAVVAVPGARRQPAVLTNEGQRGVRSRDLPRGSDRNQRLHRRIAWRTDRAVGTYEHHRR
ncbi:hypothetical protein [[Mycobacterium] wendilense]|uniref:ABC transmembrane type-1 domain-containing protein n=1 Tax=[Mycobacterium] wendilense TaxID=3064284 RepID=A0ABN9P1U1_9MYCO|nr:hypothetical protein [Mycolicibacterium sp. MU0050]CAJ1580237.1 hypothetical protein MU0050_000930 [Mycolicibacterium sp. MU0050]